jgi:type IV pilus assembly protein PilB
MATNPATARISGLARALAQSSLLTEVDAEQLQSQANTSGISFVEQVLLSRKLTAMQVATFASQTFGVPLLDLNAFDTDQISRDLIDPRLTKSRRILPLYRRGNRLFVATSDPANLQALEEARFKHNLVIDPIVVEDDKLGAAITRVVEANDATLSNLITEDELQLDLGQEGAQDDEGLSPEVDDAPVVRYLQKVMLDAINMGVSDIHFEPYEKFYRIRYRLDGTLLEVAQPPLLIKEKLASRIKVISRLDIAERRVPQDGRLKLAISKTRSIDFRVSTLPTLFGEKIVMRILDSAHAIVEMDALGYSAEQKEQLLKAIKKPYGMILVTGPTGSGKTVSLYTCLNLLNQPGINIATAEDPAEINLPGVNQVNINEKAGLTFESALRAFLRQDPDVIMVGEIRDKETADLAVKAAQTGHMVFATLHTNNAATTLVRLSQMGVESFNIASSVVLITAQRLARKLCTHCKRPVDIPREALLEAGFEEEDLDGGWQPYAAHGCERCSGTGYKGRTGIFEVLPVTETMARIIMRNGSAHDIADQARAEGMLSLRQSGLAKVKAGITSLAEVEAVTND